ncbi:MAG: ribosomal protein S18-alanine N-acetyltransferase, partial [Acidimicrobiia bacterium]
MSAVVRKEEFTANDVELTPMRRRHLRQVLKIEARVYPRPWSAALFLQEIARRSDRYYVVARLGNDVVGYGGLMVTSTEGHITTIAVDPDAQRRHIGMRLMLQMVEESINRGCLSVSLEVRKTNYGAQKMYERFGFRPVGIRRGYY